MANHLTPMFLLKRLIQLRLQGKTLRCIARSLSLTRKTVTKYVSLLENEFQDLTPLLDWSEEALQRFLQKPVATEHFALPGALLHPHLYEAFEDYEKRLARVGITRHLLWQEYRLVEEKAGRIPLAYTQFCFHFKQYRHTRQVTLHLSHKAGEELFIDFAGKKLSYLENGLPKQAEVFVAVLPCSGYCFVVATVSQKKEAFLSALAAALTFFEGVPQAIVPDNLKSAVDKADRYEPILNESLQNFAAHYQTTIMPARSRKPTDKAYVERTIGILYSRIHACLSEKLPSLWALNEAIVPLLQVHNQTCLQAKSYSRQERFEEIEKKELLPLPDQPFAYKSYAYAKVTTTSHVLLKEDKHFYSVPYAYLRAEVKLSYDLISVEIYHQGKRIASHLRTPTPEGYTTEAWHLPVSHQYFLSWSDAYFQEQAQGIGVPCQEMIDKLLAGAGYRKRYKRACYKSCAGVLSLAHKYGKERLNLACERALKAGLYTYQGLKSILAKGLEQADLSSLREEAINDFKLPVHENIRGAIAYQ